MYQAVTRDIQVRVTPRYLEERSDPESRTYFWAYTVEITNLGRQAVRLQSRYWRITDAVGHVEEVRGVGVVGKTPTLQPGATFTYSSGCPLSTASGIMVGNYRMLAEDGATLDVAIPAFSLDSPDGINSVN